MEQPRCDLTVCIPYYSGTDYLRHCLASIPAGQPGAPIEVIVVDDGSPEPCRALVESEFPDARVIEMDRNSGFGSAVNAAARAGGGRYLLILNSDARVLGGLRLLVEFLDANPDVAMVGPRVMNTDGTLQLQCRRGRLTPSSALGYATGLDRLLPRSALGEYLQRWRSATEVQDVGALSGACMMVRRDVFLQAGGFDESFILYGEDLDLSYRLGKRGWRNVYLPRAEAVHAGGCGGTARRFHRSQFLYWRALWLVLCRHPASNWFPLYTWVVLLGLAGGFLLSCVSSGRRLRRVGTTKGRRRPSPDAWRSLSTSQPEADS